jgi:hypothetical protein
MEEEEGDRVEELFCVSRQDPRNVIAVIDGIGTVVLRARQ